MLQTKLGDHPSICSVEIDIYKGISIFSLSGPLKGPNQIHMSKLDIRLPKNATDKDW
jgi:hypothetical protein